MSADSQSSYARRFKARPFLRVETTPNGRHVEVRVPKPLLLEPAEASA